MLDVEQHTQKDRPSSFAQWAYSAIGQPGVCIRVRLRGNNLHILCESRQGLEAKTVANRLLDALNTRKEGAKFPIAPGSPIYQLVVYGRTLGREQPDWIEQIRLKLPQNHDAKASNTSPDNALEADPTLVVSNENLARSGSPEAIARYLSETLSSLGVSVKVLIQNLKQGDGEMGREGDGEKFIPGLHPATLPPPSSSKSQPLLNRRLWVVCISNYSPDSSLLAEPVVQQLRSLQLKGFRDAAICSQVSGEAAPEWMLRVDLTPPEEMLGEWARWGDVQAIARILERVLAKQGMAVRAVLKDATLHLFCNVVAGKESIASDKPRATNALAPERSAALRAIAPVLEAIAPQGIHAATLYGVEFPEQETPVWVEWLNLPAADNPALSASTYSLAQQGNQEAITFLLQRLLNPDLDRRLATGGIHLKVRRKQDLLHVMSEAPICPPQAQVGSPIARFLRQLATPGIAGVRVYGRRAGASTPAWHYGVDFVHRQRLVPEATPEFAASDAYVNELVAPTGEPVLRSDLTKEDLKEGLKHTVRVTARALQRWLCYTQVFVPAVEERELATVTQRSHPKSFSTSFGVRVAMVWGALGLLLTVQADWLLAHLLRSKANSPSGELTELSSKPITLPKLSLNKGGTQGTDDFNSSGFTREGNRSVIINEAGNSLTPERSRAAKAAILAAARSPSPSFNNQLLDEKLALYQQRLLQSGPPDVLIMGSSRALRGIDPGVLQEALAAQGYRDVEVFNFGINGATAQVVDFLVRRVLKPEQLPKLIIWADGARAFNGGRADLTYNAIATSEGYQQLKAGTFPNSGKSDRRARHSGETAPPNLSTDRISQLLTFWSGSYQSMNNWLDRSVGKVSSTYRQRDQIEPMLREQFTALLKQLNLSQTQTVADSQKLLSAENAIDFDGFLPLSVRFNPVTYYKQHPRVAGDYDSDYASFKLGGDQDTALEALLQFAKARKIGIVFVNLPLTQDYLDPIRTEYEEQFQRYMRISTLERGLIFRDFTKLLLSKNDYFSDPSHLNRYGASIVSNQLARDPLIPWPNK